MTICKMWENMVNGEVVAIVEDISKKITFISDYSIDINNGEEWKLIFTHTTTT